LRVPKYILPVIVISQFLCTSLWFAGNGIMVDLADTFGLNASAVGHLTASVQLGFISGTLLFAILTIADRYAPSKVFFVSALLGSLFNLGLLWEHNTLSTILLFRFFTGFFLAGIYPVGMKIAADYYNKGLGKSLGFLVGALVLGTASPHLLKNISGSLPWEYVLIAVSFMALLGGTLMWILVPNGPYRKSGQRVNFLAFSRIFKQPQFRASAFGYFGHMWELYAFWTFVPLMLQSYMKSQGPMSLNIPLWSFVIIAIGGLACVLGGYISLSKGAKTTAFWSLLLSGICCLLFPFIFETGSTVLFLGFMLFWGMVVIADSPMFSTMVAHSAEPNIKGTALTTVNCIGFAITIVSIQLLNYLTQMSDSTFVYTILVIGPIFGLLALKIK